MSRPADSRSPVMLRRYVGDYQVVRGRQRWTPPVLVTRAIGDGWDITHGGEQIAWFALHRDIREWLNEPDGAAWLDSLPGGAS